MLLDRFVLILKVSRPRFWLYVAGPYLLGAVTFTLQNHTALEWVVYVYGLIFFLIPANIILYGLNDFFDIDTDRYNKKKFGKEGLLNGVADRKLVIVCIVFCCLLALPLFYFLNVYARALFILFLFLAYGYSTPPLRFKIRILLDSLSNILYVLPGLIAYIYTSQHIPPVSVTTASFLWAIAMHLFSAIPDIEPDKKAGIQTTAVFLGKKESLLVCSVLWFFAAIIMSSYLYIFLVGIIYATIPLVIYIGGSLSNRLEVMYWRFPYINGFLGLTIFIYLYYWL